MRPPESSHSTAQLTHCAAGSMAAPFIRAQDLTLSFRPKNREPVTALAGLNLAVVRGEFVSIVGPSGCGKSTFLNLVLGLMRHDTGILEYDGKPITGPSQERAMVFQEFGLLPWRTALLLCPSPTTIFVSASILSKNLPASRGGT